MNRTLVVGIISVLVVSAGVYLFVRLDNRALKGSQGFSQNGGRVSIVAAEDFYGDIARQIGGNDVDVRSILSDPNVDPHEYESSVQDSIAITNADIVIKNGLDYDTWIDKLISASPSAHRIVVTAGDVSPRVLPQNPHVWYGVDNASAIADAIASALEKVDPTHTATYEANLATFRNSLQPLTDKINTINATYAGTPVALTETIYLYETQSMGLHVLTPLDFERAIAEGNDPSAQSVKITNDQIINNAVKILIYNSQTVTPVTTNIQNAAEEHHIAIVPVTEMMPVSDTYQSWMMNEMNAVATALAQTVQ